MIHRVSLYIFLVSLEALILLVEILTLCTKELSVIKRVGMILDLKLNLVHFVCTLNLFMIQQLAWVKDQCAGNNLFSLGYGIKSLMWKPPNYIIVRSHGCSLICLHFAPILYLFWGLSYTYSMTVKNLFLIIYEAQT